MEKWKKLRLWTDEPGVKFCCLTLALTSLTSLLTRLQNENDNFCEANVRHNP